MTSQCCAVGYSRHILESVTLPAVTQTRASEDYHESATDQWNIGTTSIFAYAIGLAPSKVGPERTGTA